MVCSASSRGLAGPDDPPINQVCLGLVSETTDPLFIDLTQMADARGVPRGNYDDPVHDVISMAKSVPSTPMTRGPPCPKTLSGSRNLHQSGFTLAGTVGRLLTLARR